MTRQPASSLQSSAPDHPHCCPRHHRGNPCQGRPTGLSCSRMGRRRRRWAWGPAWPWRRWWRCSGRLSASFRRRFFLELSWRCRSRLLCGRILGWRILQSRGGWWLELLWGKCLRVRRLGLGLAENFVILCFVGLLTAFGSLLEWILFVFFGILFVFFVPFLLLF